MPLLLLVFEYHNEFTRTCKYTRTDALTDHGTFININEKRQYSNKLDNLCITCAFVFMRCLCPVVSVCMHVLGGIGGNADNKYGE